ncbi:enoyl-CoA hydratase [Cryptococcus deuterogattii 99/473]|uniref:Probable enoyl-CoA hydratase, mitochondrial n=2 Tax=Cryptococcus deuterogattii TaxID=1859096 RepID=A0A0D0TZ85_9TREE|nr:enoyl-CoA hydratase [Cryptococcus deuterogattii R265]KIR25816.1 enoyl-CoA hydratase [Cryptococcus deuterogattii LA55]KIR34346.1 enoyl-CoA hydratase [Cryptococcus deuterogattii MMRL2647]KIR41268.1 enoyl-CoA hydratase [Cryptococcus deuterogattii Ram5]KIR69988.1 enoyl-CoA hydratase [Cryptococcus deuterogattii CA1014]KIR89991.1 enoyl-CoA hydratase [Cryptococcus deuterogattii CBS 10090]KIR98718.1 enoyl-CoA hydratase [Cryptococcus deuterogattii 2001/935-1]KIY56238.1 enoyl-CoA hydratase [Cryptoc
MLVRTLLRPSQTTYRLTIRSMSSSAEQLVIPSRSPSNNVAILTLNRPKALNALSTPLFNALNAELEKAETDDSVRAIVITGGDKVFAAGADIKEMKDKEFAEAYTTNFLGSWNQVASVRKPIVGAVAGYALGGGCELAMLCDILIASPTAVFGQPEITLGIIPGMGGSQRLTSLIGKARAMDMVLTGRKIDAETAERWGLVSRVTKEGESVTEEAVKVAESVSKFGKVAVQAGKEAVNGSLDLPLEQGLRLERRLFQQLFATKDQKEGMAAFAEKRKPSWSDK